MEQSTINFIFCFLIFNQIYEIEPVVVTATRYPKNILEITRGITIIDSLELNKYFSLNEILRNIAVIDMKVRGDNIQADPSIRGSTFQQVLIMIDGVRVNDSQTGHHNLNIPVPLSKIERIEILHGSASSLYGSDACGGVINIITKKSAGIAGEFSLGSFNYKDCSGKLASNKVSIDFETKSSDGHEPGYEYSQYDIATNFFTSITNNYKISIFSGYLNKSFGAKNFYAPYPSWEKNQAFFLNLNTQCLITPSFLLTPILSFRTHIDTFVLDRNNPTFYANRHQSFSYGAQILGDVDLKNLGYFAAGIELFRDSLNSTRLGKRKLQRASTFLQAEKKLRDSKIIIISGIRNDHYWNIKNSINLHLSAGYKILPSLKLRSAVASSFRVPSFTELYYQDPANLGDSLLKPESGMEYEFGFDFQRKKLSTLTTLFYRLTYDDIDWVRKSDETVWQAKNIGSTNFCGAESWIKLNSIRWVDIKTGVSYIRINKSIPDEYISKYALQVPNIATSINITTFSALDFGLIWQNYYNADTRFILNMTLSKEFRILKHIKFISGLTISNLLDKRYEDFQGVSLPGRALRINTRLTKI